MQRKIWGRLNSGALNCAKRLQFLEGEPLKALREGFECKVNDITKLL